MIKCVKMMISGKVQGVFFRVSARDKAKMLGVRGWIKNCSNGAVELMAEGETEQLNEFIKWCKVGPRSARVQSVQVEWQDDSPQNMITFEVR